MSVEGLKQYVSQTFIFHKKRNVCAKAALGFQFHYQEVQTSDSAGEWSELIERKK